MPGFFEELVAGFLSEPFSFNPFAKRMEKLGGKVTIKPLPGNRRLGRSSISRRRLALSSGIVLMFQALMRFFDSSSSMEVAAVAQTLSAEPKEEIVLVFPSNTMVLNAEDLLEEQNLNFELIPVPKEVNPNCGLAISFSGGDRPEIMRALNKAGYRPSAAYIRAGDHFAPWDTQY